VSSSISLDDLSFLGFRFDKTSKKPLLGLSFHHHEVLFHQKKGEGTGDMMIVIVSMSHQQEDPCVQTFFLQHKKNFASQLFCIVRFEKETSLLMVLSSPTHNLGAKMACVISVIITMSSLFMSLSILSCLIKIDVSD
jgi:hypothetical protein